MAKGLKMQTYVEYEYNMKSNGEKLHHQRTEFEGSKTKQEVLDLLTTSHVDNIVEGSLVITKLQYTKGI